MHNSMLACPRARPQPPSRQNAFDAEPEALRENYAKSGGDSLTLQDTVNGGLRGRERERKGERKRGRAARVTLPSPFKALQQMGGVTVITALI